MGFKHITRIPVGPDLSWPPPMYRPLMDVSRYPSLFVKTHNRRCANQLGTYDRAGFGC